MERVGLVSQVEAELETRAAPWLTAGGYPFMHSPVLLLLRMSAMPVAGGR